jgi:MarR family transcriptional regulator, organic hydroperoxide resistance regulator
MKPEDCIFFQLAKTSQIGTRFWSGKVSPFNVTAVQAMVLNFLFCSDDSTSSELGKKAMLDSATLTGILDRLEATGFLERKQHPGDRRAILICLTEKGRDTAERLRFVLEEANLEFLSILSETEQSGLRNLLARLRT